MKHSLIKGKHFYDNTAPNEWWGPLNKTITPEQICVFLPEDSSGRVACIPPDLHDLIGLYGPDQSIDNLKKIYIYI